MLHPADREEVLRCLEARVDVNWFEGRFGPAAGRFDAMARGLARRRPEVLLELLRTVRQWTAGGRERFSIKEAAADVRAREGLQFSNTAVAPLGGLIRQLVPESCLRMDPIGGRRPKRPLRPSGTDFLDEGRFGVPAHWLDWSARVRLRDDGELLEALSARIDQAFADWAAGKRRRFHLKEEIQAVRSGKLRFSNSLVSWFARLLAAWRPELEGFAVFGRTRFRDEIDKAADDVLNDIDI